MNAPTLVATAFCSPLIVLSSSAVAADGQPPQSERAAEATEATGKPPRLVLGLGPRLAHAFVARSSSHNAVGASVDARFAHDRVAIGATGMWFRPFDDAGPNGAPRAETLGTFSLDVRIRIVRGGAVDLYALVGTGLAWTRPVSIIDPSHRRFSYEAALGYQAGIGARVLVAPRASLFVEARDWLHFQKDENRVVGLDPDDRSSWYGGSRLVNQVEVHVGVAMLLPVL